MAELESDSDDFFNDLDGNGASSYKVNYRWVKNF